MQKTILTIVLAALCLNFSSKAQSPDNKKPSQKQTITGKVISASNNEALPGAAIKIISTNQTIVTNDKGEFTLNLASGKYHLSVYYLSYKAKNIQIEVPLKEPLIIKLETEENPLNEVQIIGYGQTTKRFSTGSISSITAKQIEQQPVTNVLSALSGRMPGVFVQTTNGLPGGNINIQIRGKGSITAGTNPLYLIDGVPYEGETINKGLLGDNNIAGSISPLNNLNPADIESITVLKDADATSIYGSRGSNGVIIITTKKSAQSNTNLEVNLQRGFNTVAEKPKYLNPEQYLALRKEAFKNDGLTPSPDPGSPDYAPDLTIYSHSAGRDWSDYIFGKTSGSTDLQARISGGQKQTTFSASGNYHNENTVLPGHNVYERAGLSFQLQHHSENNKFSMAISNQFTHQFNNLSNVFQGIGNLNLPPNFSLTHPDGSLNWDAYSNILAAMEAKSKTKINYMLLNLSLGYQFTPRLNFKINSGYTRTSYDQKLLFPTRSLYPGSINYAILGTNVLQSVIVEPQFNYQLKFAGQTLSILAGATLQNRTGDRQEIQAGDFKLESLMEDLGSAGTIDSRSTINTAYKYASLFARLTYNISDTYVLNGTARRDGSSKFGPGNRYGNFGSIGAAWIFSNLKLIQEKLPFISYGKLRASYGTTGNDQISDYQYLSTYSSPSSNIYQDIQTIRPSRISNADFHWETTAKTDIAVELGLFKDRVLLSADYYISNSKDQLVNYTLPLLTGFASYQANIPAVVQNKGWEFSLNTKIMDHKDFSWSASFNLTLPENKLKSFENFATSSYAKVYELGDDINRIYGVKSLGIDALTGKAKYAGKNGEVAEDPYPYFTLGKLTPDYYGGLGNQFKIKNVQLDVFMQFVKQVAQGGLNGNLGGLPFNTFNVLLDRWTPENPKARLPKATTNYDGSLGNSSLNIFDASYLRLKHVLLAYNLSNSFTKKLHINHLRLSVSGQNLLSIWHKNAAVYDPESGLLGNVPPLKSLVFGFQFSL